MGRILLPGVPYHIDNVAAYVGKAIGVSDWFAIDRARIHAFGRATEDMNRLHVDPEWAARHSPFGGIVAHGFLTLSLLPHLSISSQMMPDGVEYGINLGFERIRFLAPVPADSHIRMRSHLLACEDRGVGRWMFRSRCAVEVKETQKAALSAVWTVLFIDPARADQAADRLPWRLDQPT
jgi:acyl dehydratase